MSILLGGGGVRWFVYPILEICRYVYNMQNAPVDGGVTLHCTFILYLSMYIKKKDLECSEPGIPKALSLCEQTFLRRT